MPESARGWQVILLRQPEKTLRRLPRPLRERIRRVLRSLADDPRPVGCKKLVGHDNLWRVRIGDWQMSYAIEDDRLVVLVIELAPRGDAYRNL